MPSPELVRTYPSTTDTVPDAVSDVQEFAETHRLPTDLTDRLLLAVAEAVANSVEHGNKSVEGRKVLLRLSRQAAAWTLRVTDEGLGLSQDALDSVELPTDLLDTGGRGLYILQQLADTLWLEEDGRCLCLRFSTEDGAPS